MLSAHRFIGLQPAIPAVWTIGSHQGVNVAATDGTALIDTGAAFVDVSADLDPGTGEACLVFGSAGPVNPASDQDFLFLRVGDSPGLWHFFRTAFGDTDLLIQSISLTTAANYSVSLSGSTVTVKQGGSTVATVTLAGPDLGALPRTWVGIRGTHGQGSTFDNFTARGGIVSDTLTRPDGPLGIADTGQRWWASADHNAAIFPPYSHAPTDVTGLLWWLDAAQISGLADADPVSTWPDSSGNGYNATGSGASRPSWRVGLASGHPTVDFDGAGDYLATSLAHASGDFTFYFVVKQDSADMVNGDYLFDTQTGRLVLWSPGPALHVGFYDGTVRDSSTAASTAGLEVYEFNLASGSAVLRRNGTSILSTGYTQTAIGGAVSLGSDYTGSANPSFDGQIAEVIVYSHALNSTDRGKVNTYLNEKYGFAL